MRLVTFSDAEGTRIGVHDAESAAWVVRRVVEARQYAQRVRVWAEVEQRRAEAEERGGWWTLTGKV